MSAVNPRLIVVALVLVGAGVAGIALSGGEPPAATPTQTPDQPSCLEVPSTPASAALPTWLPKDLSLPDGSYVLEALPTVQGLSRAVLVVPASLDDLVKVILDRWPKEGWTLGPGEREPGEAEDTFYRGAKFGQFRALQVYCDQNVVQMFLVMGKSPFSISPNPTPSGSVGPLVSATPTP